MIFNLESFTEWAQDSASDRIAFGFHTHPLLTSNISK